MSNLDFKSLSQGDLIAVSAKHSVCSLRTKNRVKENGPEFYFIKTMYSPALGADSVLLQSSSKPDWVGWLPIDEIHATFGYCFVCGETDYENHKNCDHEEDVIYRDRETGEYWNYGMGDDE